MASIFKGMKEFWDTSKAILILKLLLIVVVIGFALLALFTKEKLLGFAMIGMGIYFIVLGIESKFKNAGNFTLIISSAAAILLFAVSAYIFSHPLM